MPSPNTSGEAELLLSSLASHYTYLIPLTGHNMLYHHLFISVFDFPTSFPAL